MNNQHNTIGSKVADRDNGQPTAKWPIFDYSGNEVGVIEAEYDNANFNRATRECRWVVTSYHVSWFDVDNEGWFDAKAHGTTPKALAAARRYAKGTTAEVRARWPVVS